MGERITLRDVALEAGVHTSTASRALNADARAVVNPLTVDRVMNAAERLGYSPHPLARGLRTNQTMTVGIVIPDVGNPLFGPIIAGAESTLGDEGYSLLIADAGSDACPVVENLIRRYIDGLILATVTKVDETVANIARRRIPAVLVNRYADGTAFPAIVGDDHVGIGMVVKHLVSLGHRAIGHVGGPKNLSTGMGRYQAFLSWMQSLGLEVNAGAIEEADVFKVDPGYRAARALLNRRPDLTAIVAGNDLLALGCYRAIREAGREVGSDVSVTGYNDMPLLDLMQPSLTSVRVPYRQMGAEAAKILVANLREDDWSEAALSIRLTPTLSVRNSTQPPAS